MKIVKGTTASGAVYFGFGDKVLQDFKFMMHVKEVEELSEADFIKELEVIPKLHVLEQLDPIINQLEPLLKRLLSLKKFSEDLL